MTLITMNTSLAIKSNAFKHNEFIPEKYTCNGLNINPDLKIDNLPENTKSLAAVVYDMDSPTGVFVHWVIWDIPPKEMIEENSAPGIQGKNSYLQNKYVGPCPTSGTHHYHFKIYALDSRMSFLPPSTNMKELEDAIKEHVITTGELIGLYKP